MTDGADPSLLDTCHKFMGTVRKVCSTAEGRSDLRSGLTSDFTENWRMLRQLIPAGGIPSRSRHPDSEKPFLLIASLWATYAAPNPRMDGKGKSPADPDEPFGWSLAHAVKTGVLSQNNAEGSLSVLCQLDTLALHQMLPGIISQLRTTPISWPRLLRDLLLWNRWADNVRTDWARAYYTHLTASKEK